MSREAAGRGNLPTQWQEEREIPHIRALYATTGIHFHGLSIQAGMALHLHWTYTVEGFQSVLNLPTSMRS